MYIKAKSILAACTIIVLPIRARAQDRAPMSGVLASGEVTDPQTPGKSSASKPTILTAKPKEKAKLTRVTGIGGVFIKAKDPVKLRAWYKTHLGIDVQAWGGTSFRWVSAGGAPVNGKTAWYVSDGSSFSPSQSSYMINYRVADLAGLLQALRDEGCEVLDKMEKSDFGMFGWVMDPEGNKVELWQPPAGQ